MKKNDQSAPYSKISAIKYLLIPLFLLIGSIPSWSQCAPAGATCSEAMPISFPFNSRMNVDINGAGEIPFCNGIGFFHNSSWYSFVPTSPFIFIDITADNCSTVGGNQGVQMGLFSDCDPNAPPIGQLQCECTFPGETITLGGVVTPGETYYILVDGCSGSTCDLQMVLTTGSVAIPTVNLGTPAAPSTFDPIPTCPGATLDFSVPPVVDADIYTWSFPPGTTIVSQDCNTISVIWGPIAGDVSVSATNSTNLQTNSGPPLFVVVDPPVYSLTSTYCGSSTNGYFFYGDNSLYEEGFYTITVSGNNCDTIVSLTVIDTEPILTLSGSSQSCQNEGMATATITGGLPPFSYQWSNGATGPTIDNLMSGDYTVTVTSADGCTAEGETTVTTVQLGYSWEGSYCGSSSDGYLFYRDSLLYQEGSYTIMVPGSTCDTIINLTVTNTQPILTLSNSSQTCENEGTATVATTGGVPPFTYAWSNGLTSPTIDSLIIGDYTVTVTGADGCSSEGETTITFADLFDLTVNSTPADCDESNGTASVTITGEVLNPAYAWSNGATDSLVTELSPGLYAVTVTDTETNCQIQENVEIVENPDCSANCPVYTVSDGNITVTSFNTARTKIRSWNTEDGWQQVFKCNFDCNDPTIITGLSGEYRLKIDAFDDDYNYICKVDEDLVISSGPCIDNDDDGICASEDCDDNDPNFPTTPGTACNDNNPDTDNDQIQSDGCTCAGTTAPPTNGCPTYTVSNGMITVTGFNTERTKIRLWSTEGGWQQVFECDFDCSDPTVITELSGEYRLKIDAFDDDYNYICKVDEDLVISSGPCIDNDNDGVCASEDCDDNDPNFPTEVGTTCDDNNPDTTNDQIQSDGCTCVGIPETTDCATIIMTVDNLTIIGNHPNQIIKVFNADWEFVFQCSGDCPNTVVIDNLSEQVYHIKVDAYDSDWNFVCQVREDLIPGASSANLRDDNADLGISKLTLFPNPTWGVFTLNTKDLNGSGVVKIYNATGQAIQQRTIEDLRAQDFLKFDLSNNSSGVYYVVVQFPQGKMLTERVVVLNNQ